MFKYDSMQFQHNNTTHRTVHKLPTAGKEHICFQIDGKSDRAAQYSKSRALNKWLV